MNRLFATAFDTPPNGGTLRRWMPAMDLDRERRTQFVLSADLPGLAEEDVKIEVENRVLTVSGERRAAQAQSKEGYRRVERASGSFSRSLTLPEGVDADAMTASFDRGVLEIRDPEARGSASRAASRSRSAVATLRRRIDA